MNDSNPYETYADEYESWFNENDLLFSSELDAIRQLMPSFEKGLEIGVGTGLFAQALGIKEGIEPSAAMRKKAELRGVRVIEAFAEALPFADESYDLVLMVTVDCFLKNIHAAYQEAHRILKSDGTLIVAFIDQSSPLGQIYEEKKQYSPFYSHAHFHSAQKMKEILMDSGFKIEDSRQTVFTLTNQVQEVWAGTGQGVFAVIQARKV
jgi:SAM-dependent methyltransferase